jgi:NADH dehydrogenase FAD-containing subunit
MTHRVVVVGSGFGGLFAVKALATTDVGVTLKPRSACPGSGNRRRFSATGH